MNNNMVYTNSAMSVITINVKGLTAVSKRLSSENQTRQTNQTQNTAIYTATKTEGITIKQSHKLKGLMNIGAKILNQILAK